MGRLSEKEPSFTIGVEEEYLIVDKKTRDLASDPPETLVEEVIDIVGEGRASPEFLRAQLEVGTKVCSSLSELRADLTGLRLSVAEVCGRHGLAPMAASTHPFAKWREQRHTDKERYAELARDLQSVVQRLMICGAHVHVGLDDDALRIDLMSQVSYFLPHLLALSTSSPFWGGEKTGLMSYRLSVFDELPRTGLPEQFESATEYERHVQALVDCGLIEDASKIWWDVRPSCRFPTLEMRILDMCAQLDDVIAIAALYLCILRMLYRLRRNNQRWRRYANMLIAENRWRAQRYGLEEPLVDFGKGSLTPFPELIEELLYLVRDDVAFFEAGKEMEHIRHILDRGSSSHRQLKVYEETLGFGQSKQQALEAVVDDLVAQTVEGLTP